MSAPQLRLKMAFTSRVWTWLCILSFVAMTGCHDDLHPEDRSAGIALRKAGAVLGLDQAGRIIDVRLTYTNADDTTLQLVTRVPHIRGLFLERTFVTDQGLEVLRQLHELRVLSLTGTDITSGALPCIASIPKLHTLRLDQTQVGDKQLDAIKQLRQLHVLSLSQTQVSDRSLPVLQSLHVKELSLHQTRMTPLGLLRLKNQSTQMLVLN